MSEKFQDLELAILREAVDKAEQRSGRALTSSPEIKNMIQIVEEFLRSKKLICYGGTAINNTSPTRLMANLVQAARCEPVRSG